MNVPRTIEPRQEAINEFHSQVFKQEKPSKPKASSNGNGAWNPSDDELLAKVFNARNGEKVKRLFNGDTAGYRSRSEADMALCSRLAVYTKDKTQIDRLYRGSKLFRDKWDEKHGSGTYGERTIAKAIDGTTEHYTGGGSRGSKSERETFQQKKDLPTLNATDHNLARISDAALKILVKANNPPFIFRHADCISRKEVADDGAVILRRLSEDSLRGILGRKIAWYAKKKKAKVYELPPIYVVKDILANDSPPFPVVTRVVRAPIFAADGTLTKTPGYSAAAKVIYDPGADLKVSPVPAKPAPEDVLFAREQIADILFDFPFVSDAERAHTVALLCQPFVRELIDGPTPLLFVEKPSPGTGAGLLCDVATSIFLGRPAAVLSEGKDEDEWRKRITAKLVHDNAIILIDNVRRRLDSSALSAALTCLSWEDRILGRTEIIRVPVRATWIATGNNPSVSNEIARRTVRIRLDSKVDRPWLREGFRHANLREYVRNERGKFVWCALVLIRDWLVKGRPSGVKELGAFESWSRVMGGIVENAGFQGFLSNLEELYDESDSEGKAWRQFTSAWWNKFGDKEVGVSDLFSIIAPVDGDSLDLDLGDKTEKSQKTKLGLMLKKNRDRQFEGKRIIRGGTEHGAQLWRLEDVKR